MINYNIFYTAVSSDVPYVATECTTDCTDKAFFDALNDQLDELLPVSPLIGRRISDVEAIQNTKDQTLFNVLLGRMQSSDVNSQDFSSLSNEDIANTVIPRNLTIGDLSRLSYVVDTLRERSQQPVVQQPVVEPVVEPVVTNPS